MPAASHLRGKPRSPRNGIASAMVASGLRNVMAVASARGIRAAAANMQLTLNHPHRVRAACSLQAAPAKRGRSQKRTAAADECEQNRPALIWKGCNSGPCTPRPSALASREVIARSALAPSIIVTARPKLCVTRADLSAFPRGRDGDSCSSSPMHASRHDRHRSAWRRGPASPRCAACARAAAR